MLRIDTAGVFAGYLCRDLSRLIVQHTLRGDSSLWNIALKPGAVDTVLYINSLGSKRLLINLPEVSFTDTTALMTDTATALFVNSLPFLEDSLYRFTAPNSDSVFLSLARDDTVILSSKNSAVLSGRRIYFRPERVKNLPDTSLRFMLYVDTAGVPNVVKPLFLSADTTTNHDSLIVTSYYRNDLSLWKLSYDTIVHDTCRWGIKNVGTGKALIFSTTLGTPVSGGVSADKISPTGTLKQWLLPFYSEGIPQGGFLQSRNPSDQSNYFLSYKSKKLYITGDTTTFLPLHFMLRPDGSENPFPLDTVFADTTKIYRIKYVSSNDSLNGKYLGADIHNGPLLLDTVYAHVPDGQFVVGPINRGRLLNRQYSAVNSGTLYYIKTPPDGAVVPDLFTNLTDTFRLMPIDYGGIETLKLDTMLGYKRFTNAELKDFSYAFKYVVNDSLLGRLIGFTPNDSIVRLFSGDTDTVRFSIRHYTTLLNPGAPAIADIPNLKRNLYTIRLLEDTTLYLSTQTQLLPLQNQNRAKLTTNDMTFSLKEDAEWGKYSFVFNSSALSHTFMVDSTSKALYVASYDTVPRHIFTLIECDTVSRVVPELVDSYVYCDTAPGMYHLSVWDELRDNRYWLTRNWYNLPVFRREGESMLRAATYEPKDLRVWLDTTIVKGVQQPKRPFYIVHSVDTTRPSPSPKSIVGGYFLHVQDTVHNASSIVIVGGKERFCLDFIPAVRYSPNELLLNVDPNTATSRDSIGFVNRNDTAISQYQFYLQRIEGVDDLFYIATEAGHGYAGVGEDSLERGYLSMTNTGRLYVGPRGDNAVCRVAISSGPVANEMIIPSSVSVTAVDGGVRIYGAVGLPVAVYNVLGQKVVSRVISSDDEVIAAPRGVAFVKIEGDRARKVVVR
jgi:hypothetical protein